MPPSPYKRKGPPQRQLRQGQIRKPATPKYSLPDGRTSRKGEKLPRPGQARRLNPRPADLDAVRAAVRALQAQAPRPLDADDLFAALSSKCPAEFWMLVDAMAFETLKEVFVAGNADTKTPADLDERLAELMVEWLRAEVAA